MGSLSTFTQRVDVNKMIVCPNQSLNKQYYAPLKMEGFPRITPMARHRKDGWSSKNVVFGKLSNTIGPMILLPFVKDTMKRGGLSFYSQML